MLELRQRLLRGVVGLEAPRLRFRDSQGTQLVASLTSHSFDLQTVSGGKSPAKLQVLSVLLTWKQEVGSPRLWASLPLP